ncbi:MAG: hemerythrin family protein [Amphritea sp.]
MPLIEANVVPRVALDFMNNDHAEAIAQINTLNTLLTQAGDGETEAVEQITAQLEAIYQHNAEHFAREEAEMVRVNFPPFSCHKGEHDRVLAEFQALLQHWQEKRDLEKLTNYVRQTLPQWLRAHVETMDTVTAMYVASQS